MIKYGDSHHISTVLSLRTYTNQPCPVKYELLYYVFDAGMNQWTNPIFIRQFSILNLSFSPIFHWETASSCLCHQSILTDGWKVMKHLPVRTLALMKKMFQKYLRKVIVAEWAIFKTQANDTSNAKGCCIDNSTLTMIFINFWAY